MKDYITLLKWGIFLYIKYKHLVNNNVTFYMTCSLKTCDHSSLMNMTLFFHNEDTKSDGGVEMIKQIGKVISSIISILFSSIVGICHLVVLTSLGLIGVIAGILTCLMPILGLLSIFSMENIFIIWNDIQV